MNKITEIECEKVEKVVFEVGIFYKGKTSGDYYYYTGNHRGINFSINKVTSMADNQMYSRLASGTCLKIEVNQ